MNRATGTYQTVEHSVVEHSGRALEAFIPYPLPSVQKLELDKPLINALAAALYELGRLEGVAASLADKHIFRYLYIRQEAVLSSQIEGSHATLLDLFKYELHELPGCQDTREVANYVKAIEHGLRRLRDDSHPVNNRLLREMHAIAFAAGPREDIRPGEFRDVQNASPGQASRETAAVPLPHFQIEQCMHDLDIFLDNDNSGIHPLIKAGLAHAQFETIQPFREGNGRLGRLLVACYLCHEKTLSDPMLCLSLYFRQNQHSYTDHLGNVRASGDWESWLEFFLEGVRSTACLAVEATFAIRSLLSEDSEIIAQQSSQSRMPSKLHTLFETMPVLTVTEAARCLDTSFRTASIAMQSLCKNWHNSRN